MAANQVLQAIQKSQPGLQQGTIDVAAAYDQRIALETAQAELAKGSFDANGNTPEQVRQAEIGKLQAQEYSQEFARLRGMDPNATSDLLRTQAENARNADLIAMQQGAKINALESVGLTDNPIEYLLNQWMLPDEYVKYDGAVAASKEAHRSIQSINEETQSTSRTAMDIANIRTVGSIDAAVQASKNSIMIKADEYKIKSAMSGADKIKSVENLKGEQLQRFHMAYQIQNSEERLKLEREAAQQRRKEWKQKLSLLDQDEAVRAEYVKTISSAEKALGLPATDPKAIPGLLKMEGQKGVYYRWLLDRGYAVKSGSEPSLGESVAERALVLNTLPGLVAGNKNAEMVARLVHGAPEVAANSPDVQGMAKTKEGKLALAEKVVDNGLKSWAKITPGDPNNPMASVPFSTFAADAEIASSPVWQGIVARLDMKKAVDIRDVINAATSDIKAGTNAYRVDDVAQLVSTLMKNYEVKANEQARTKFIAGRTVTNIRMPVDSYGVGAFLSGDAGKEYISADVNAIKKAVISNLGSKASVGALYDQSGITGAYLKGSAAVGTDLFPAAGGAVANAANAAADVASRTQINISNIPEGRTAINRSNNPIVTLKE